MMASNRHDNRGELGLRPVINASGTMTALGASIVLPEFVEIEAMARVLPEFVEIAERAAAWFERLLDWPD